jgi:hypothetical protein
MPRSRIRLQSVERERRRVSAAFWRFQWALSRASTICARSGSTPASAALTGVEAGAAGRGGSAAGRQHAQALLDQGRLEQEMDVLAALKARLPETDADWPEVVGLVGRG